MIQEESISFLLHCAQRLSPQDTLEPMLPEEAAAAQAIAEAIDGLPLALDQTGAYIEATQCCLSDYLHLLQAHPIHLLQQRHADSSHPSSVVATFTLAFTKLQRVNPTAADLLAFCAFLAPDTIPEEVIMQGAPLFGRDLQASEDNPLRFNVLYRELLAHSLIRRNAGLKTVIVHRLLQVVCRAYLAEEQQRWIQWAVQAINKLFPTAKSAAWSQCERLLPHALAVLEHLDHLALSEQEPDVQVEAALLREKITVYLADRAVLLQ